MRSASWEPSPGALLAFVNSTTVARKPIDLYTITLKDGTVLRWAANPTDVVCGSYGTFLAHGTGGRPIIIRGDLDIERGIKISSLAVTMNCGHEATHGGKKFTRAVLDGVFRDARLQYEAAVVDLAGAIHGAVCLWEGRVEAKPKSTSVELTVESYLAELNHKAPLRLIQPYCPYELFDARCGVAKTPGVTQFTATASSGSTTTITTTDSAVVAKAARWFEQGIMSVGGVDRTVRSHTVAGGVATFVVFPAYPVAVGTGAFTLVPGCAKTFGGNGCAKFANQARFGGCPATPREENAR